MALMGYRSELVIEFEKRNENEFLEKIKIIDDGWFDCFDKPDVREENETCVLYYWNCIKVGDIESVFGLFKDLNIGYYSIRLGENDDDNEFYGDYNIDTFELCMCRSLRWENNV
jgi:hypothetical protein